MSSASTTPRFTEKQGQYLAFIYMYTLVNDQPPAEADMQRIVTSTTCGVQPGGSPVAGRRARGSDQ